jgi:N-acetylmuramoyl-L-alanine amidase CwlA
MSYTLKTNLANKSNYGDARSTSKIKYIVIHYTANDGDTSESNGKYFKNNVVKASAHYFVDSDSVTQSVPDNYVAWSVGGKKFSDCATTGGGTKYGVVTNTNSISIELCDDKKDGNIYPSSATIKNALELTRTLMKKYGVTKDNVVRHFDVTGKSCPAYWCGTGEKNKKWESEFMSKLSENEVEKAIEKLAEKGVINTADYWKQHYKDVQYLDTLICNMAAKL